MILFLEGGTNVDNWAFDALMNVVSEFHQQHQPANNVQNGTNNVYIPNQMNTAENLLAQSKYIGRIIESKAWIYVCV